MTKTTEPTVTPEIQAAADHYIANSEISSNGIRKITKGVFIERLGTHGITEAELKAAQSAVDFETTVAAHVALHDLNNVIKATDKAKLKDEEFRRGLQAAVRLPTLGGSTTVTVHAETSSPIPARGEDAERGVKISHGRVATKIVTKGRIAPEFHEHARAKLRASLGIKDD